MSQSKNIQYKEPIVYEFFRFFPTHWYNAFLIWIILPTFIFVPCFISFNKPVEPLPLNSELNLFSEERARVHLKFINYTKKTIGTEWNDQTKVYIVKTLEKYSKDSNKKFKIDIQFHDFTFRGYHKLQNVVCKIHGTSKSKNSLLISSHFDAVTPSYGTSDDSVGVVNLLEIFRILTSRSDPPSHDVIFAFVNGEEVKLLGSKAFTSHPWFRDVKMFLNTDSIGGTSDEILYKLYPSSLIKLYSVVPHPHTTATGELISKMLPTDTDYKNYKENGAFGFDFAFSSLGYGYHNLLDSPDRMKKGAIQHHGDNHLALILEILNSDVLDQSVDQTSYIYFDFMGLFLVYYPKSLSILIQLLLIILGISLPILNHFMLKREKSELELHKLPLEFINEQIDNSTTYSLLYFVSYIMSLLFGIIFSIITSLLFFFFNTMGWYYSYKVTLLIFGSSTFLGLLSFQWVLNAFVGQWCCQRLRAHRPKIKYNGNLTKFYSLQKETYIGLVLFWTLLLFIITMVNLDGLYPIVIYSLFAILGIYVCFFIDFYFRILVANKADLDITETPDIYLNRYFSFKYMYYITEHKVFWFVIPICLIIPNMITYDVFSKVLKALVPLLEAMPGYSDLIIAGFVSLCIGIILISYLPILHQSSNFGKLFCTIFMIFAISLTYNLMKSPYSIETPLTLVTQNYHKNRLEFNLEQSKVFFYENATEYYLVSTHINIAPHLSKFINSIKKPYLYECRYYAYYSCKIEKTELNQLSSIVYSIVRQTKDDVTISLKPLIPSRFTSLSINNKVSFNSDLDKDRIVLYKDKYYKYGYDQHEWMITISKNLKEQVPLTFSFNYCDIEKFSFLDQFLKFAPFIQIQGDPQCSIMKVSNEILIK